MNWLPALGLAVIVGAPLPKEPPKKTDSSIVGEWEFIRYVGGGRQLPADPSLIIDIEFTADGKFRSRWGKITDEGKYVTDLTKDPAQIDLMSDSTPKRGEGIYKIEKDMLTLCIGEVGDDRPTKLGSPAGTRITLITYRRVNKNKE